MKNICCQLHIPTLIVYDNPKKKNQQGKLPTHKSENRRQKEMKNKKKEDFINYGENSWYLNII